MYSVHRARARKRTARRIALRTLLQRLCARQPLSLACLSRSALCFSERLCLETVCLRVPVWTIFAIRDRSVYVFLTTVAGMFYWETSSSEVQTKKFVFAVRDAQRRGTLLCILFDATSDCCPHRLDHLKHIWLSLLSFLCCWRFPWATSTTSVNSTSISDYL